MWRKWGALQGESSAGPMTADLGTSVPAGLVRAATQTDTEKQLDAGAARTSSDRDKSDYFIKKHIIVAVFPRISDCD